MSVDAVIYSQVVYGRRPRFIYVPGRDHHIYTDVWLDSHALPNSDEQTRRINVDHTHGSDLSLGPSLFRHAVLSVLPFIIYLRRRSLQTFSLMNIIFTNIVSEYITHKKAKWAVKLLRTPHCCPLTCYRRIRYTCDTTIEQEAKLSLG